MSNALQALIDRYREDSESVFHTWFINNEERLKFLENDYHASGRQHPLFSSPGNYSAI